MILKLPLGIGLIISSMLKSIPNQQRPPNRCPAGLILDIGGIDAFFLEHIFRKKGILSACTP